MLLMQSLAAAAGAETRREREARSAAEWEKFESRNENVCLGEGYLVFSYGFFDRKDYRPVLFPPSLPRDLMATLAASVDASKDPGVGEALRGRFNEALNEKIEDLRSGRYNQITVRVKKGASFWLTPSEDQKEALLVWVPRVGGVDFVLDGKVDPKIPVYVLSPDGALAPMDKTTRPSWLVGPSNIYEAGGGSLSSERKRARLLTRCE
jgi:hypothetical protein